MKNILLTIAVCASIYAHAQINVGSSAISQMNKAGKLSDDDIAELKKTTTLFVLQWRDYDHVADFEKVIAEVWKVSKFQIIKPDEIVKYSGKDGFSIFSFGGYYVEKSHGVSPTGLFSIHLSYDLWIPEISKKGKVNVQSYYSRTLLSQDATLLKAAYKKYARNFDDNMMSYIYNEAVFNNWGAGFLKGYLLTINSHLMEGETRGRFTSDWDEKGIAPLKNDTLFVPDYINVHFSPYTGVEKDGDKDQENLKESYDHKLKLITAHELNDMLMNRSTPFYYLVYVRSASDKFVNVYHSEKGMVYGNYTPTSYNFKYKDLSNIDTIIR